MKLMSVLQGCKDNNLGQIISKVAGQAERTKAEGHYGTTRHQTGQSSITEKNQIQQNIKMLKDIFTLVSVHLFRPGSHVSCIHILYSASNKHIRSLWCLWTFLFLKFLTGFLKYAAENLNHETSKDLQLICRSSYCKLIKWFPLNLCFLLPKSKKSCTVC